MKTDKFEEMVLQAIEEGKKPFFLNTTAGTVILQYINILYIYFININ
jgi:hypothetical protein